MKSLVIYHRKRGSVHGCVIDSQEARKRLETALSCIENHETHYALCEIDGDWRDYGYEELADACRRQCKPENEDQQDDKIYVVVPRGITPVRIFGNGKERETNMRKFSNAMMLAGNLHEGDYVETVDGRVGYVKGICRCEKCRERGFYEPTVHFTDGEEDCITKYEAENGFKGYKRIGRWENEKAVVKKPKDIFHCGSVWKSENGTMRYVPDTQVMQDKINELIDAVNELRKAK
nr:MAG TPA_asm: hypothetical protein [Caudoviricetes sp.]